MSIGRRLNLLPTILLLMPTASFAEELDATVLNLTSSWVGYLSIALFFLAYIFVVTEEFTHLRKSKPVIIAAGVIWGLIALVYARSGIDHTVEGAVKDFLAEFAALFLFLLVAMTYVNAMVERRVFEGLRVWLINKGFGYRTLFWITGGMSFFISPLIDNMTTALVMCAVVMAVGKDQPRFISLSCINIVVAANAGGAFSPFGDITTLMIWQAGLVDFSEFFALLIPSAVNFLIPAFIIQLYIPKEMPLTSAEDIRIKRGANVIVLLFAITITTAVCFHTYLHLPPFLGMMTGLGLLKLFGYYLKSTHRPHPLDSQEYGQVGDVTAFDSFRLVARAEWDTLLFFFGVIMCVGALSFIGYMALASDWLYGNLGPTLANSLVGILSAVVDNIPVMIAVIQMNPHMEISQWLLVTLTAGVGGSLLSIGSAAGVALMGQAKGSYTFFGHLKWTPVIAVGYVGSIFVHLALN